MTSDLATPLPPKSPATQFTQPVNLHADLLTQVKVQSTKAQNRSLLIRTASSDGQVKSVLLHVRDQISVIPTFENSGLLNLQPTAATPNFYQNIDAEKPSNLVAKFFGALSIPIVLTLVTLFITGSLQTRVVLTGSMSPTYNPGSVLILTKPNIVRPAIGKVVIYTARDASGKAVTQWAHRIVGGDASGWEIKGDANPSSDYGKHPSSDIKLVVLFGVPFIGKLLNPTSIILIGIGLLLISGAFSKLTARR